LSEVLEDGSVPRRFYLSARACQGILRRAEKRGKQLPADLGHRMIWTAVCPGCGYHWRKDQEARPRGMACQECAIRGANSVPYMGWVNDEGKAYAFKVEVYSDSRRNGPADCRGNTQAVGGVN
jgi:hypothetical protein